MRIIVLGAMLASVATPAAAQQRGYVQGLGGVTFMAETAGLFGGEAGLHLTPEVIVFGQAGRFMNVLPDSVLRDINETAKQAEAFLGRALRLDVRIRATYAGGGVKYLLPVGRDVRPYAVGSVGFVNYQGSLREAELGDLLALAIAFGAIDPDQVEGNEPAYEVGGGVVIARRRLQIDAGYRLMNVRGVNISRIVAGVGARF